MTRSLAVTFDYLCPFAYNGNAAAINAIREGADYEFRYVPFSLAQAHNAFPDDGRIANEQLHERFENNIANFMDLVEAATHYPCVKRAWVEYLGEQPDPLIDRVESTTG